MCSGGCFVIGEDTYVNPADEKTIKEIDDAKKLEWQSQMRRAYHRIAMREGLNDGGQVYLVKAVFETLELDSTKEMVLMDLIMNPQFSEAADKAITRRLDWITLEKSKQRIKHALELRRSLR